MLVLVLVLVEAELAGLDVVGGPLAITAVHFEVVVNVVGSSSVVMPVSAVTVETSVIVV